MNADDLTILGGLFLVEINGKVFKGEIMSLEGSGAFFERFDGGIVSLEIVFKDKNEQSS